MHPPAAASLETLGTYNKPCLWVLARQKAARDTSKQDEAPQRYQYPAPTRAAHRGKKRSRRVMHFPALAALQANTM